METQDRKQSLPKVDVLSLSSPTDTDNNDDSPFLNLPALVADKILDYLQMNGLKNLRITCRTTKLWIDHPRYLRKLPLYIKNDERLNGLLVNCSNPDSFINTGWTHATIAIPMLSYARISLFLKAYERSLESVKIGHAADFETDPRSTVELIDNVLCHLGPNLRSLRLHGTFALYADSVDRPWTSCTSAKTMSKLRLPHLVVLEFVGVNYFAFAGAGASNVNSFLAALLKMCPNLTTLKLPIMNWSRPYGHPQTKEQLQITFSPELHPLIAYLNNMMARTRAESQTGQISVELSFDLEHWLDWDLNAVTISLTTLLELTEACRPLGGQLFNVPDTALPSLAQALLLAPQQLAGLDSTIATVVCRWTLSSIQSSVYVPLEAKIVVRCADIFSGADMGNMQNFKLNESLNISSIGVNGVVVQHWLPWLMAYWMLDPSSRENLNRQLFGVIRPTVEHLHLGPHDDRRLLATIASNLQTNFPNLKVVSLAFSPPSDCDCLNQVIIRLPSTVQEIRVSDSSVDDFCFLGGHLRGEDYSPIHVRLPNLTELTLNRCGMSALSNVIFESTLIYMRLKVFGIVPAQCTSCEITFRDGLVWLVSGSLKETLEKLDCFIPPDTSEEEMTHHFSGFHRLRTCCLSEWIPPPQGGGFDSLVW